MYSFLASDIQRRVYTPVDYQYEITHYGSDNLYPQIMEELYKRSPLTKQAIHVLSEFSFGKGWARSGDKIVNRFGQTFNDLLRLCAEDLNTYSGFSLHLNFNALGRIVETQYLSFPYVRLGMKNREGITDNVKVSPNWEQDSSKSENYSGLQPVQYPLFNAKTAAADALTGGQGQVLYWTPRMFSYPLATFDAIRDSVQTDHERQVFYLKNIQNGFLGTNLIKIPGGFDSEEDKRKFLQKLKELQGAYNANSSIAVEWPEEFTGQFIEPIPAANNDNLLTNTAQDTINTILQNFGVPGPLLAVNPQGSVFTQEQIRDSYILMNLRTENKRKILERVFDPIGKLMQTNLGEIEKIPWEIPGQNAPVMNGDHNQDMRTDEQREEQEGKLRQIYG